MVSELSKRGQFDEILVIPSKVSPHKIGYFAPEEDRLFMSKLAFSNIEKVKVLDIELKMSGKSYTLLTLNELRKSEITKPTLVIGADSLLDFHKWYNFEEILKMAKLLVYKRAGIKNEEISKAKENLEGLGGEISILDICPPDISSTTVRNYALNGKEPEGLISKEVWNYIMDKKLYSYCGFIEPQFFDECIEFRAEFDEIVELLKEHLTEKRFYHTLSVAKEAVKLAKMYGADTKRAFLAGLLHDICKDMTGETQLKMFSEFGIILDSLVLNAPKLWHSFLGAEYIKNKLSIKDQEIIDAVRYHTTAAAGMTLLQKILYIADFTSEERNYDGVELMREAAYTSMEKAMYEALLFSVNDLKEKGKPVHPDTMAAFLEAKSIYLK